MVNTISPSDANFLMQETDEIFAKSGYDSKRLLKGNWFRVPNALIDHHGHDLCPSGIAVYCVLARHANNLTHEAFPSHSHIAKRLGISRRTVIRKLRKLEEIGHIRRVKRKRRCCVYLLE